MIINIAKSFFLMVFYMLFLKAKAFANMDYYNIIYDDSGSVSLEYAVSELYNELLNCTSIKVFRNKKNAHNKNNIYIGKVPVLDYVYKKNYGDGFVIEYYKGNIFIYGNDTLDGHLNEQGGRFEGTSNGIYRFISLFLNSNYNISLNETNNCNKNRINWNSSFYIKEDPPFFYRELGYIGNNIKTKKWIRKMLLLKPYPLEQYHAWTSTIPIALYDKHPEWFANIKNNIAGNKYKLETTNPYLVQEYAKKIIKIFDEQPNRRWYSLSPSDGSLGWSESHEALALLETDKNGKISRTKLILKFYNDVAKLVHEKYPNHKLGGILYASYLFPPSEGIPHIMPNISLVLAPSFAYGFGLYQENIRKDWLYLVQLWGENAKKQGYDIYYYDLPTWVKSVDQRIIVPPAPSIINFIFHNLYKNNFKGAYIYGCDDFEKCGVSNYMIASMLWNPQADAEFYYKEYIYNYYGKEYYGIINDFYKKIESSYIEYCHSSCGYDISSADIVRYYKILYKNLDLNFSKKIPKNQKFKAFHEFLNAIKPYNFFEEDVFWRKK